MTGPMRTKITAETHAAFVAWEDTATSLSPRVAARPEVLRASGLRDNFVLAYYHTSI